jgi:hypothetical protein
MNSMILPFKKSLKTQQQIWLDIQQRTRQVINCSFHCLLCSFVYHDFFLFLAMQSSFYRTTSFEIDPNKMDEKNKAFLNENVIRLMLYAQHLFNAIVGNVQLMPKQLRQIYRHARDRLSAKYPQHERKAVSSLLFLVSCFCWMFFFLKQTCSIFLVFNFFFSKTT